MNFYYLYKNKLNIIYNNINININYTINKKKRKEDLPLVLLIIFSNPYFAL